MQTLHKGLNIHTHTQKKEQATWVRMTMRTRKTVHSLMNIHRLQLKNKAEVFYDF